MARKKPEIAELPTRFLMQELGSKRPQEGLRLRCARRRRARRRRVRRGARRRGAAHGGARGGLRRGERLPARRRGARERRDAGGPRGQREARGGPARRPESGGGWPQVCAKHAFALSALDSKAPLGAAAEALGKQLETDANATQDLGPKITALWAEAEKENKGAPPADAVRAPKPAAVLLGAEVWSGCPSSSPAPSGSRTSARSRRPGRSSSS